MNRRNSCLGATAMAKNSLSYPWTTSQTTSTCMRQLLHGLCPSRRDRSWLWTSAGALRASKSISSECASRWLYLMSTQATQRLVSTAGIYKIQFKHSKSAHIRVENNQLRKSSSQQGQKLQCYLSILVMFLRRRLEKKNKRKFSLKRIALLKRSLRQTSLKGKYLSRNLTSKTQ